MISLIATLGCMVLCTLMGSLAYTVHVSLDSFIHDPLHRDAQYTAQLLHTPCRNAVSASVISHASR